MKAKEMKTEAEIINQEDVAISTEPEMIEGTPDGEIIIVEAEEPKRKLPWKKIGIGAAALVAAAAAAIIGFKVGSNRESDDDYDVDDQGWDDFSEEDDDSDDDSDDDDGVTITEF